MKKTIKNISLMLAVIMLLATMPLSAIAAGNTDTANTAWKDGTTLLKMDGPFGITGAETADGVTVSEYVSDDNKTMVDVKKVDGVTTYVVGSKNGTQAGFIRAGGISTNLPLNGTAKYTIKMNVKYHDSGKLGVLLSGDNYSEGQGIFIRTNYAQSQVNMIKASGALDTYKKEVYNKNFTNIDVSKFAEIVIQIDGYDVILYVNGEKYAKWVMGALSSDNTSVGSWVDDTLSIAFLPNTKAKTDEIAVEFDGITVYAGDALIERPYLAGVQYRSYASESDEAQKLIDIRFAATLKDFALAEGTTDSSVFKEVGFDFIYENKYASVNCYNIYKSLTTEAEPELPSDYNDGDFFFCYAIYGLEAGQTYTFDVSCWTRKSGESRVYGAEAYRAVVNISADGATVDINWSELNFNSRLR